MIIERTSVGLDVHARSVVGCGIDNDTGEVFRRRLTPDPVEILAWTDSLPGPVKAVYETGPTGFGLARYLRSHGTPCLIAASSKLQRPTGDRVKTDASDALHLARLLRLGEIVEVTIPSVEQEAARDLVRAREDARADLMRARHRLSTLLLRQEELAAVSEYADVVRRLCCLRGISTLTGFGLAVEIGDWHRLTGASIGSYVGLVPSEYSSGASRKQGAITKTGNGHVRRLLVEAAWHHRKTYRTPGATMRARWDKAPMPARVRGHEGNRRLHQRWMVFTDRKKKPAVANVAIARELAGWCWSLAVME